MPDTHPEHTYLVARVIAPWGLNGDVTLEIISTNPDRFRRGSVMFTGDRQRLTVGQVRQVSNKVVVGFREVQTREGAEALQGAFLHVPEADLPVLAPDSYYHHQILGLRVRTTDGRDLGEVTDILTTGANDVYVVTHDGGEYLVPAIADVVQSVDLNAGLITIDPLPGLLD